MKTTIIGLLVGILLLGMSFGCDKRHITIPSEPTQVSHDDALWVLAFRYSETLNDNDYYNITLYRGASGTQYTNYNAAHVTIDGQRIALNYQSDSTHYSGWYSAMPVLLTENNPIKLSIYPTSMGTVVNLIHPANVSFPASYNHEQPMDVSWTVESKNQYQFVRAESWSVSGNAINYLYESKISKISKNDARHRFGANCISLVNDNPDSTSFVFGVEEVNYKIVKGITYTAFGQSDVRFGVMVYQDERKCYNSNKGIINNGDKAFKQRVLDIAGLLSDK